MPSFYLLKEDGGKISLEAGTGAILLETIEAGLVAPGGGGGGGWWIEQPRKKRKREDDELFWSIEHALEVALGLVDEPVEAVLEAQREEVRQTWSEDKFRE